MSIPCCLDPCLHSCFFIISFYSFHPPSVTRWHLTPPHIARCTPSPAPRSRCCGRIRPWASRVVGPGTSGTSRDPWGWWCGAAGGTRTAAEPGPGLYRTCQCSGNTWRKKKWISWMSENNLLFWKWIIPTHVLVINILKPLCVLSHKPWSPQKVQSKDAMVDSSAGHYIVVHLLMDSSCPWLNLQHVLFI